MDEKFWARVNKTDSCWLWTGSIMQKTGYGVLHAPKPVSRTVVAHRFFYEQLRGPIPPGLELDHLCRVRHCVNPDHMEPVTRQENNRRSDALKAMTAAISARVAHGCIQGHPYPENEGWKPGKSVNRVRYCLECNRLRAGRWYREHHHRRKQL